MLLLTPFSLLLCSASSSSSFPFPFLFSYSCNLKSLGNIHSFSVVSFLVLLLLVTVVDGALLHCFAASLYIELEHQHDPILNNLNNPPPVFQASNIITRTHRPTRITILL